MTTAKQGNCAGFARALLRRDIEVWICTIHSLGMRSGVGTLRGARATSELLGGAGPVGRLVSTSVEPSDVVWVWGRPHPSQVRQIYSLLHVLEFRTRLVNRVSALALLDSKASVHAIAPNYAIPDCLISSRFVDAQAYARDSERDVVAKPLTGDSGASVYVVRKNDSNAEVILQSMTGDEALKPALCPPSVYGIQTKYAVFQPLIPELPQQEKRVIIAGGKVVVAIGKQKAPGDHRARTAGDELQTPAMLSENEAAICDSVAARLQGLGVNFAGIDLSAPYVVEINIANPGGLSRLRAPHQEQMFDQALAGIVDKLALTDTAEA